MIFTVPRGLAATTGRYFERALLFKEGAKLLSEIDMRHYPIKAVEELIRWIYQRKLKSSEGASWTILAPPSRPLHDGV